MIKFGHRCHCGSLADSLKTSKYISNERFNKFLPEYQFYAYDERCKQYVFILRDIESNLSSRNLFKLQHYINWFWLFIEVQ